MSRVTSSPGASVRGAVAEASAGIKKEKSEGVSGLKKGVAELKASLLAEEGRLPSQEAGAVQQPVSM